MNNFDFFERIFAFCRSDFSSENNETYFALKRRMEVVDNAKTESDNAFAYPIFRSVEVINSKKNEER